MVKVLGFVRFFKNWKKIFCKRKFSFIFASAIERYGAIAQLVEQRTENPCVPGSIPGGTTTLTILSGFFCFFSGIVNIQ